MPTLHWIGKEKVINHHRDIPFRVLEPVYHFSTEDPASGTAENKIIHGDNLEALKALLPEYEGRIKCIYIDPPYNTGNENWAYNDNVNDPKIQKWLQQVVGKEGEDLSRHDKWLCMMYPRLKLLHKLLANDGAIFVSIDDNEQANLKLMMDEIFGAGNILGIFIWHRRQNADSRNISRVSTDHEYVFAYSKNVSLARLKGKSIDTSKYNNPDNDPRGPWASIDLSGLATAQQRPNLHYDIVNPETGISYPPNPTRGWSKSKDRVMEMISNNEILFPKSPNGRPRQKKFLADLQSTETGFSTLLSADKVGFTTQGTKAISSIFGRKEFDFPKPVELIKTLIYQSTDEDSIILDSFAGSGTTAHAVLNLNKENSGNRRFILVEMEDYADNITAERVKRVMRGYGEGSNAVPGTGGCFSYYELGPRLFDEDNNLNEKVDTERIRQYIWFSETSSPYQQPTTGSDNYFLGSLYNTAYYFIYEPGQITNLDYDFLATVTYKSEQYVIYADNCLLPKELLQRLNIMYKKIPRDISRF